MGKTKSLSEASQETLLQILQKRFEKNKHLHRSIKWEEVKNLLEKNPDKIQSIERMEETGGEPNVFVFENSENLFFVDCSLESPKGRRSFCYDRAAWEKRKEHKPENTVIDLAEEMGVEILTEDEYRQLQEVFPMDLKTSSWIKTPENIRKLGGALFCDRRYDTVFTYHNGAESYYAARGFRAKLKL